MEMPYSFSWFEQTIFNSLIPFGHGLQTILSWLRQTILSWLLKPRSHELAHTKERKEKSQRHTPVLCPTGAAPDGTQVTRVIKGLMVLGTIVYISSHSYCSLVPEPPLCVIKYSTHSIYGKSCVVLIVQRRFCSKLAGTFTRTFTHTQQTHTPAWWE